MNPKAPKPEGRAAISMIASVGSLTAPSSTDSTIDSALNISVIWTSSSSGCSSTSSRKEPWAPCATEPMPMRSGDEQQLGEYLRSIRRGGGGGGGKRFIVRRVTEGGESFSGGGITRWARTAISELHSSSKSDTDIGEMLNDDAPCWGLVRLRSEEVTGFRGGTFL